MNQAESNSRGTRLATGLGIALPVAFLLFFAIRGLLPDPTADLFWKAQRLEGAGQLELALRQYMLLTNSHPESAYAPRALEREANILVSLARRNGKPEQFRQAQNIYLKLAQTYPESSLSGDALLAAADIAFTNLRDYPAAQKIYASALEVYPNDREIASAATLRLGRIALSQKNGPGAQTWFQRVLQRFPTQTEIAAEAQYLLGVTYETLFKNAEHTEWSKNAYEATFKRYPQTTWANNARQRLGLLFYVDSRQPQERRVWIEVPPLPAESTLDKDPNSPLAALRLLLATRGIEASLPALRGWSLVPFYAALDANDPSRTVTAPFDQFQNILANSGLRFKPISGGNEKVALQDLQDELDEARPPLVYLNGWQLAVGYDSNRGQVWTQRSGARVEAFAVKDFATQWKEPSPLGGAFTMLSVFRQDERLQPRRQNRALPTPKPSPTKRSLEEDEATPTPTPTPQPSLSTPTWVFTPKALSERDTHRATVRRAAQWMKRRRDGRVLLNLEALATLSREFRRLSKTQTAQLVPTPIPEPIFDEESTSDGNGDEATPTPTRTTKPAPLVNVLARTRALLGWFEGSQSPLQAWLTARRDAAVYCNLAANSLNASALQRAAQEFGRSIQALEDAAAALPSSGALSENGSTLTEATRAALQNAAQKLQEAHDAENRALIEMSKL
jgi:tetratricopeptide (TPR) repeat protein